MPEPMPTFGEFSLSTSVNWLNQTGPDELGSAVTIEHLKADPVCRALKATVRNLHDINLITKVRLVTIFGKSLDPVEAHRRTPRLRIEEPDSTAYSLSRFEDEARNSGTLILEPRGSSEISIKFGKQAANWEVPLNLYLQLSAMPMNGTSEKSEKTGDG